MLNPVDGIKVAGITRLRNEAEMIESTLDHFAAFCNAGIFVYDDASTDNTPDICEAHPAVRKVLRREKWDPSPEGRQKAEGSYRNAALLAAREISEPDWVFCFDADEHPEMDLTGTGFNQYVGIRLRLFDFYITPEDKDLSWEHRSWIGPEYRDILMFFKNAKVLMFPDREPALHDGNKVVYTGFVKHYGKAKSVEEWEATCDYYANHLPEPYKTKWLTRKGHAIKHDYRSDFGNPLIKWEDRFDKAIKLTGAVQSLERRRNGV